MLSPKSKIEIKVMSVLYRSINTIRCGVIPVLNYSVVNTVILMR